MPRTQLQRMMFALMTVIITVHAYVFYSLYVVNGQTLMNVTGQPGVIKAINSMGGVYMVGRNLPIWAVVLIEFMLAYVKHICIHSNVQKSLEYILNPEKTEELLYTTSLNCTTDARDAYLQMKAVYEQYARDKFNSTPPPSGNGTVKAIHYIQSFDPKSNITPELAHKITKAFVRKTFGDDVQAVITTHVDRQHIHSHVIINSYSLSGHKFYANKDSLNRLREYSDGVCRAFGIEPSPNFKGIGRNM